MPRPISATVHTSALANNLAVVRRCAPHSKVWAIVKANAYGHGIARAFAGLQAADGFGLLDLHEAVCVRELGWRGPILLLEGVFQPADLKLVEQYGLTTVVHCDEQLDMIASTYAQRMPSQPIAIYLKMNSGMNRLGYPAAHFRAAWERARACPAIGEIVLMTHFANADNGLGIADQMGTFVQHAAGIDGARCLSNSAAVLWHPHLQSDWVRPGIMLYGASPSGAAQVLTDLGLQAGMTLSSEIIAVQNLSTGAAIGYGSIFTATEPLRIGVVACGYADGYPRHAPNGTPILVDGVRTRIVGRVSMDMVTVDLTPCPNVGVGTPVELWGKHLPIDEVAYASGTIGYELMCAVAQRVPIRAD